MWNCTYVLHVVLLGALDTLGRVRERGDGWIILFIEIINDRKWIPQLLIVKEVFSCGFRYTIYLLIRKSNSDIELLFLWQGITNLQVNAKEETFSQLTIESISTLESESVHHTVHLVRVERSHLCTKLINLFDFSSNSLPFAHSLVLSDYTVCG